MLPSDANALLNELQQDIAEIKRFHDAANRPRIKKFLSIELRKMETEFATKQEKLSQTSGTDASGRAMKSTDQPYKQGIPTVKLTSYAFDQSEKFVKLYMSNLQGVQNLSADDVTAEYTEQSFNLMIRNLNGKNYTHTVTNLLHPIDPSKSTVKIKTDCVLIMLKKAQEGLNWAYLTNTEQKTKEKKTTPKIDKEGDPSAGLMSLMKQMYEEGDDDMKRTIAKAWTESRDKQAKEGLMDM